MILLSMATMGAVLSAAPASYGIVVGNNASPVLGRPHLKYADDDAARMTEVLTAAVGVSQVELLTDFDEDTANLFPGLAGAARSPTKAEVTAAFERMRAWAEKARSSGTKTRGYFVFAGHGDLERGQGFVELKDGRLTAEDVERLLSTAGADELHVVLDSCNSWFVLSPRKPGGRQFPTPGEATRALAQRLPHVGVLLSTSAEAEVYEWSDLQSGIFSYALRSGLIGGADANRDGEVSYRELAAFIDTATKGIKNPNLRPKIFARGPGGSVGGQFASLVEGESTLVTGVTDAPVQLRLLDSAGLRWFDLSLPAGASAILRLPRALVDGVVLKRGAQSSWVAFQIPRGERRVDVGSLTHPGPEARSRGSTEALQGLFSAPFDEGVVTAWETKEKSEASTVGLGISNETIDRVSFLLTTAAARDRAGRYRFLSVGGAAVAAASAFFAAGLMSPNGDTKSIALLGSALLGAEGLALVTAGLIWTPWETQLQDFARLRAQGSGERAVFELDRFLAERQRHYEMGKTVFRFMGGAVIAAGLSFGALALHAGSADPSMRVNDMPMILAMSGALVAIGTGSLVSSIWLRAPEQDLHEALREERRLGIPAVEVGVSVAPIPSGIGVSVSGRF